MNLRPSGYEPDELPGCSTPRRPVRTLRPYGRGWMRRELGELGGPGGDLLFRRLSGSTMGAEGFHGRVRDGIGCLAPRYGHQAGQAPLGCEPRQKVSEALPPRSLPLARTGGGGAAPAARDEAGRCTRAVVGRRLWPAPYGIKPIERLVPVSCTGCPASTSGLSTWWSTTALGETWF